MDTPLRLFLMLAVFIVSLIPGFAELHSAAYLDMSSEVGVVALTAIVVAAVFASMPLICDVAIKDVRVTKFLSALLIIFAIYQSTRPYLRDLQLTNALIIALILTTIVAAYLSVRYLNDRIWLEGLKLVVVSALAWMIAPSIVAFFQLYDAKTHPTLNLSNIFEKLPAAVVILVLDETSPEMAGLIASSMQSEQHELQLATITRAGKDTINAIPSMLTRYRHDDVTPCGAKQLCGIRGSNGFAASRLVASNPKTDVVGFYHPYCAIQGLRHCERVGVSHKDFQVSFGFGLIDSIKARIPFGAILARFNALELQRNSIYQHIRSEVERLALTAPFWMSGGGLLYIHSFLPHPSGFNSSRQLNDEYQINLIDAAKLVEQINQKLKVQFNDDYALIVTSDHPLRTRYWCSQPAYQSENCMKLNPVEGDKVPFMVLAPKGMPIRMPTTSLGVFSG